MANRYYETTFIVDSILEDDKIDSIVSRYTSFFTKNGGEVVKTDKWGRRKLSYPIKKRTTGFHITIEFTGEPSIIAKLERAYHLDDEVLRFLVISYDKKSLETRNSYLARKEAEDKARAEAREQLLAQGEKSAEGEPLISGQENLTEVQEEENPVAGLPVYDSDESKTRGAGAGNTSVDAEAKEKEKSE
jgi:small subunit ribosomal protein S6